MKKHLKKSDQKTKFASSDRPLNRSQHSLPLRKPTFIHITAAKAPDHHWACPILAPQIRAGQSDQNLKDLS
ncbi:hypothetical protein ACFL27_26090, partial [candidate division CSSED10-310 bacterium]